jgi:hypothetical protein
LRLQQQLRLQHWLQQLLPEVVLLQASLLLARPV